MSSFDLNVGTCGCCRPPAPATPLWVHNRPSLDAVDYRVGTYASFRQAMIQLIPEMATELGAEMGLSEVPLRRWTSRDSDDYGIAVIEMWATIGDILTFYTERYANEAWLRTANHRDSLRRLAGLLGYRLGPGVAAGTYLSYELDDGASVVLRAGLKAQSVPKEDEQPQKFETAAELDATSALNRVPIYGAPVVAEALVAGSEHATLTSLSFVPLPADPIVLFTRGEAPVEERSIAAADQVDGRNVIRWSAPLDADHTEAHLKGRAFRLFGHNAPATQVVATPQGTSAAQSVTWDTAVTIFTATTVEFNLDGTIDGIEVGSQVLIVTDGVARRRRVDAVEHVAGTVKADKGSERVVVMTGAATRISVSGQPIEMDRRTTRVYELPDELEFLGWEVPQTPIPAGTSTIYLPYPEIASIVKGRLVVLDDHLQQPMIVAAAADGVVYSVDAEPDFLELTLTEVTTRPLDAATAHLLGNVVAATHGATVADEVLGNGDASVPLQAFQLAKDSVTHLSDPTARGGAQSTLQLTVDRVRWAERSGLFGALPNDRVYSTSIDDDHKTVVRFGNGDQGARLPTGRANVFATYRQGLGLAGNVETGQIATALDKPTGVSGVTNPLPARGGVEPEATDAARENAPNTVRTFDRAVSLRDFADLAREFTGVEKAFVTWVWDNEEQVVHVTVGGDDGAVLSSDQLHGVRTYIDQRRDPNRALRVDEYSSVPFVVEISIEVDPNFFNEDVKAAVEARISDYFDYDNRDFGQAVHVSDLYSVAHEADGVVSALITVLRYKRFVDRLSHGVGLGPVLTHAPIRGARHLASGGIVPAELAILETVDDVAVVVAGGLVS